MRRNENLSRLRRERSRSIATRVRVIGSAHDRRLVRSAAGLRADPITLILDASHLDLSRA